MRSCHPRVNQLLTNDQSLRSLPAADSLLQYNHTTRASRENYDFKEGAEESPERSYKRRRIGQSSLPTALHYEQPVFTTCASHSAETSPPSGKK